MNARRQKRVQKTLGYYQQNFGFHPPFNILLDGTFCRAALEAKVNIKEQLPKYFNAQVNIVTTQCVIMEVEKLSKILKKLYGVWLVVKQFRVHKCGHKNSLKSAAKCIKSLLQDKNPHRYIVATMDSDLRAFIHNFVVGVPIIYLHGQSPTIEKPVYTEVILKQIDGTMNSHEFETLEQMKEKLLGPQPEDFIKPKKKKAERPNPLSCLKKSKQKAEPAPNPVSKKRRRKGNKEKDLSSTIKKVFASDKR